MQSAPPLLPRLAAPTTAAVPRPGYTPPRLEEKTEGWVAGRDLIPATPAEHQLRAFCQGLAKVDLHRHLEGAVTPELLVRLSHEYGFTLPTQDVDKLRPYVQVTDKDKTLLDFLKKFDTIGLGFTNYDAVKEITVQAILDAAEDNVKYLELRFSPLYIAEQYHLQPKQVMQAVVEGTQAARLQCDTKTNLMAIVERELPINQAWVVEKLAEQFKDVGVIGLDLANDEFHFPPAPFAPVFQAAHDAGLHITVHAGEAGPAANVKTSIEQLHAERIGHGVQTAADPAVEKEVLQSGTALEMCPTSNEETHAADGLPQYPLRHFFDEHARVTINTDDPSVCGITLSGECYKVIKNYGFSIREMEQLEYNAVDAAFLTAAEKTALKNELRRNFDASDRAILGSKEMQPWLVARS